MANSFLKAGKEVIVRYVDKETAEVLAEEKETHSYIANSSEQFFLGYFSLLPALQSISGPAIKTYFYLLITYKSGILIGINKAIKKNIQTYLKNKSLGTINNCLTELCQAGLLIKQPGELAGYYINPRFAYIGNTTLRNKALKEIILTVSEAA